MSEHTYDIIYQCSIEEYAKAHGTSIQKLIKKAQKDIDIMMQGKRAIFESIGEGNLSDMQVYHVSCINAALDRKQHHIERLEAWIPKKRKKS